MIFLQKQDISGINSSVSGNITGGNGFFTLIHWEYRFWEKMGFCLVASEKRR